MKQKPVIQLDDDGYMVGTTWADESPAEPGVFLIPGGCISIDEAGAPNVPDGQRARWTGAAWALEAIPQPPAPPAPPTAAELRRSEILSRLDQIDRESIRALRSKSVGKGQQADSDKLTALDNEADALRAELATL